MRDQRSPDTPRDAIGLPDPERFVCADGTVEDRMRNVEFKAEVRDLPLAGLIVQELGARWIARLEQTDTYFRVPHARLKKRETLGEPPEWIFYERADSPRPRVSSFMIYSEAEARERFGIAPLPVLVVVRKSRDLYMHANVRMHLDRVEDLGDFLELEAMVTKACPEEACRAQVTALRAALAPVLGEPISAGYSDLLMAG